MGINSHQKTYLRSKVFMPGSVELGGSGCLFDHYIVSCVVGHGQTRVPQDALAVFANPRIMVKTKLGRDRIFSLYHAPVNIVILLHKVL